MKALLHTQVVELQRKSKHEKYIKFRAFLDGGWHLLYDSRFKNLKEDIIPYC